MRFAAGGSPAGKVERLEIDSKRPGSDKVIVGMARSEIDRSEPDEVENMPKNNSPINPKCFPKTADAAI